MIFCHKTVGKNLLPIKNPLLMLLYFNTKLTKIQVFFETKLKILGDHEKLMIRLGVFIDNVKPVDISIKRCRQRLVDSKEHI